MSKQHILWSAAQCAETCEQCFFKSTFGSFGTPGKLQGVAKDFSRAAVNDRNEYAPAIPSAVDQGKVSGPALIGIVGNGARGFDSRAVSRAALGKCPAFVLHDAVHLFAVDLDTLNEAQPAPCPTDTACGFFLVNPFDTGSHRFVQRLWCTLTGVVIGAGSSKTEPLTKFAGGQLFSRREQDGFDLVHDLTSGNGFPCTSQAIL